VWLSSRSGGRTKVSSADGPSSSSKFSRIVGESGGDGDMGSSSSKWSRIDVFSELAVGASVDSGEIGEWICIGDSHSGESPCSSSS